MEIVVNGKTETLDKEISVVELLEQLGIAKPGTAIAINNQIVPRDSHTTARICDGDRVEIIRPIGGG
jgi:sulfur carrier protein